MWVKASRLGLTSFMLPERYGGAGMTDCVTGCIVQEELSHGCSGIGNLITSGGFFAEPVLALGSEEQKQRWLAPLAGEDPPFTALAITEPQSGSDAASIRTRARRADGGYVLIGQKAWISNGGVSRFYVVFATVEPRQRPPRDHRLPASRTTTRACAAGRRCARWASARSPTASCSWMTCSCPTTAASATRAPGFTGLMHTFDRSRVTLAASATGLARAALEYATAYAKRARAVRQADRPAPGGRLPPGRHGPARRRQPAVDLARGADGRPGAARHHRGGDGQAARLRDGDVVHLGRRADARRLGLLSREYPVEKWMRDAKLEEIEEGTSDIQRLVISRGLLR